VSAVALSRQQAPRSSEPVPVADRVGEDPQSAPPAS